MANSIESNCEEEDDNIKTKLRFMNVCSELNIDCNAKQEAWEEFSQINRNVTLEVMFINCCL